jgi:hypothetical protein
MVPFQPNDVQGRYLDMIIPDWRSRLLTESDEWAGIGCGKREILLKARQFGFSTLILALFFIDTVNSANTKTVVIAHDSESTEGLFRIVRRFYDHLPAGKRPTTKYSNRRELLFKENGSSFSVMTAGTKTSGRSTTIDNLHCSEVAFWRNSEVLTGLLQAVTPDGNIFQETTANGEGNAYWEAYQAAKEPGSVFNARFFAWFDHAAYASIPPLEFTRTAEEVALGSEYGLTDAQLWWRRSKCAEPGMGNLFRQEYPANDIEAFKVSGAKYFTEWDETIHVIDPFEVPPGWRVLGALDWGYGSPYCFLLAAVDANANVYIIDESYGNRVPTVDQAKLVAELLQRWSIEPRGFELAADPAMWASKTTMEGGGYADIDPFEKLAMNCVRANNARLHGWMNLRKYLCEPGKLRVFRGRCPNLVRTIPIMVHDPIRVEDLNSDLEDHAVDALRYLLQQQPLPKRPGERHALLGAPRFLQQMRTKTYL